MSYTKLWTHIVFGTKDHFPFLFDSEVRAEVHAYLGGIIRNLKGTPLSVGGVADHAHIIARLPASLSIADALRTMKSNSSSWVHERWPRLSKFGWQIKYAAFSVSESNVAAVVRYIENQEEHHRRKTFKEEFEELLRRHGVQYDPKYLWK